jgi:hypothetical protein
MKRILLSAAAAAAVTVGGVAAAAPAMAASGPSQFVTHVNGKPDTTSLVSQPPAGQDATISTPYGPVWAWDDITVTLSPVPVSGQADGANYRVDVQVTGSFRGFADPNTGTALASAGPVKGAISYDVLAAPGQAPDAAGLPATEAGGLGGAHLSDMVTQLFDGNAQIVGGGSSYTFSYQNGAYVQDTTGTHGAVRGR